MSSGFVSEKTLEEKKKARQEEWEKVRKPDDPEQAPEDQPVWDGRSLYDQLQAHKNEKQEELDEARQFKNQIRGIDDDEADFLDKVDDIRSRLEREQQKEVDKELEEHRKNQEHLREQELENRLKAERARVVPSSKSSFASSSSSMTKKSQSKLLIGAVKRANPTTGKANASSGTPAKNVKKDDEVKPAPKALGALAGLGDYSSSEEDDDS